MIHDLMPHATSVINLFQYHNYQILLFLQCYLPYTYLAIHVHVYLIYLLLQCNNLSAL